MINKTIAIVHTSAGSSYANKVARSIAWINSNKNPGFSINTTVLSVNELDRLLPDKNLLIHARAAIPSSSWMDRLMHLESSGCKVVNNTCALRLTSDKLRSSILLREALGNNVVPQTYEVDKLDEEGINKVYKEIEKGKYVLKPYISKDQGKNVTIYSKGNDSDEDAFFTAINNIPTNKVVLQDFVNYTSIYRVIVINGVPLPVSFEDRIEWHPDNWKVSVCLNKTSMRLVNNPDIKMLNLAVDVQKSIGGSINFIDIFKTEDNKYVLSEINTACNLSIHERLSGINIHYKIAKELIRLS